MRFWHAEACAAVFCLLTCSAGIALAQVPGPLHVTVAVLQDAPPFSYQGPDGTWRGLAVDLWHFVADQLQYQYELQGMDRRNLLASVAQGRAGVGIGPIAMTAERFTQVDFSVPYFVTGLAIAVPRTRSHAAILLDNALSPTFLRLFGSLFAILIIVAALFWLFERRKNPAEFGGRHVHGLGSGLWLAVVTMTTVGYGDKSPKTLGGRVTAVIWMFVSLLLVATFTGTVASVLTANRMGPRIKSPDDLFAVRVVTVENSAAASFLEHQRITALLLPSIDAALDALAAGRADALASDRALLKYMVKRHPDLPITILPGSFFPEFYCFVMPRGAPYRVPLDAAVLGVLEGPEWGRILFDYIGNHVEHLPLAHVHAMRNAASSP